MSDEHMIECPSKKTGKVERVREWPEPQTGSEGLTGADPGHPGESGGTFDDTIKDSESTAVPESNREVGGPDVFNAIKEPEKKQSGVTVTIKIDDEHLEILEKLCEAVESLDATLIRIDKEKRADAERAGYAKSVG